MQYQDNAFVITGGPGSGKTALVHALAAQGFPTTQEVGRRIIQEQRAINGMALPWKDRMLFAEMMLSWEMRSYANTACTGAPVFCDRGIPDVVGYLELEGIPVPHHMTRAVTRFRYAKPVFLCPPWPDIFEKDAERMQTLEIAERTYEAMVRVYAANGYDLIDVPLAPVAERVAFVLDKAGL
jgi:predicted ATPase